MRGGKRRKIEGGETPKKREGERERKIEEKMKEWEMINTKICTIE